jgi:peptidyl-tRNA hydrolase
MNRLVDLSKTYVYVIDESLGLSKGKIAAQVSHVAMMLADQEKVLGRVIVLKADHSYFNLLCNMPGSIYIEDAGLTEVSVGTRTCVGFAQNELNKGLTKKLKLV